MAYAIKYQAEFRSEIDHIQWKVNILRDGYSGAIVKVKTAADPLHIVWEKRDDAFNEPLKASEASIELISTENFKFLDLFTSRDREYQVKIYRSGSLFWLGYITPGIYSEQFCAPPYTVKITATDGFEILKSYRYRDYRTVNEGNVSAHSIMNIVRNLLGFGLGSFTDLGVKRTWAASLIEEQTRLCETLIAVEDIDYTMPNATMYDMLVMVLRSLNAFLFQDRGTLYLFDVDKILYGSDYSRRQLFAGGYNIITADSVMDMMPTVGRVHVNVGNGLLESFADRWGFFDVNKWTYEGDEWFVKVNISTKENKIFVKNKSFTIPINADEESVPMAYEGCITFMREIKKTGKAIDISAALKIERVTQTSFPDIVLQMGIIPDAITQDTPYVYGFDGEKWNQYSVFDFQTVFPKMTYKPSERATNAACKGKSATYDTIRWSMPNVPIDGQFVVGILFKATGTYDKLFAQETLIISDVVFKFKDEPISSYDVDLLNGGSGEMTIDIPVADIAQVPNNDLIYGITWRDPDGKPTNMWTNGHEADTLARLAVDIVDVFHGTSRRRITGSLIRPTSVPSLYYIYTDEAYTKALYRLNYLDIDARRDNYDVQLVEFDKIAPEPPAGDDCILYYNFDIGTPINETVRVENRLYFRRSVSIYVWDPISNYVRGFQSFPNVIKMRASGHYLIVVTCDFGSVWHIYAVDALGSVRDVSLDDTSMEVVDALYSDEVGRAILYVDSTSVTNRRLLIDKADPKMIGGAIIGDRLLMPEPQTVVLGGRGGRNLQFDARIKDNVPINCQTSLVSTGTTELSRNLARIDQNIYRRTGINLSSKSYLYSLTSTPSDMSNDTVTVCPSNAATQIYRLTSSATTVSNLAERDHLYERLGAFIIQGDVYIAYANEDEGVRIYKYIR